MKKTIAILFILFTAMALVLPACGGEQDIPKTDDANARPDGNADSVKEVNISDVYNKLIESGFYGQMLPVDDRDMQEIYGIDTGKIKSAAFYMSDNPAVNADEIAIFEVSDPEYMDTLYNILCSRIDAQLRLTETYSVEQHDKLSKTEVKVVGNYCYYIVNDNYSDLMKIMKENIG